jgi:hypothetical protein
MSFPTPTEQRSSLPTSYIPIIDLSRGGTLIGSELAQSCPDSEIMMGGFLGGPFSSNIQPSGDVLSEQVQHYHNLLLPFDIETVTAVAAELTTSPPLSLIFLQDQKGVRAEEGTLQDIYKLSILAQVTQQVVPAPCQFFQIDAAASWEQTVGVGGHQAAFSDVHVGRKVFAEDYDIPLGGERHLPRRACFPSPSAQERCPLPPTDRSNAH